MGKISDERQETQTGRNTAKEAGSARAKGAPPPGPNRQGKANCIGRAKGHEGARIGQKGAPNRGRRGGLEGIAVGCVAEDKELGTRLCTGSSVTRKLKPN